MTQSADQAEREQHGVALVAVLWMLVILSLIAASIVAGTLTTARSSAETMRSARLSAVADAGLNAVLLGLMDHGAGVRCRIDGVPCDFTFDATRMSITVQDEGGKIDLNAGSPDLLSRYFEVVGKVDKLGAQRLADAVVSWRGSGASLTSVPGMASSNSGSIVYRPRKGPLQSSDELELLDGMTAGIFQRLASGLTVYSQRPLPNPATAPRQVLAAMPGMSAADIDKLIDDRRSEQPRSDEAPGVIHGGYVAPGVTLTGWTFSIEVSVADTSSAMFSTTSVVRITEDPATPFWVMRRTSEQR